MCKLLRAAATSERLASALFRGPGPDVLLSDMCRCVHSNGRVRREGAITCSTKHYHGMFAYLSHDAWAKYVSV